MLVGRAHSLTPWVRICSGDVPFLNRATCWVWELIVTLAGHRSRLGLLIVGATLERCLLVGWFGGGGG